MLHIYLLHAPDFLGYPDAIAMARDEREVVERGLRLKKAGNRLMDFVGGRAIHPINVRLGGFYRSRPDPSSRPWPSSCAARWTTRWRPSSGRPGSNSPTSKSTTRCWR